jgi:hypothetical protein
MRPMICVMIHGDLLPVNEVLDLAAALVVALPLRGSTTMSRKLRDQT